MIFQVGDRGPQVVDIQKKLMESGFGLPKYGADGIYGSETAQAVVSFQLSNNLNPTGVMDDKTYAKLFPTQIMSALGPKVTVSPGTGENVVQKITSVRLNKKLVMIVAALGLGALLIFAKKKRRA